jgi:restriction system protein
MEGHEFEYFCAELLERCGFEAVTVTRGSGDQGVDILAFKEDIKYAIQCKNYSTPLGNKPIQEVNAGKLFYHCHVGVVMTNSSFTPGAKEIAEATGVLLWDRVTMQEMLDNAK